MARLHLANAARADLKAILEKSLDRWGEAGRSRYASLLAAAMRSIAEAPKGPLTRTHAGIPPEIRSFHIRHARREQSVKAPVHIIYFQIHRSGNIEIARILHDHLQPSLYLMNRRSR